MLSEQAKEARRLYKKEWARRNPDKIRAQQERYWQKKAAQYVQKAQEARKADEAQDDI